VGCRVRQRSGLVLGHATPRPSRLPFGLQVGALFLEEATGIAIAMDRRRVQPALALEW